MNWRDFHAEKKILIENLLVQYLDVLTAEGVLRDAMRYSLDAGGKRLRPFLAILTSGLLNKNERTVYPFACALEFIHTYSLIHDDLPSMDNDDMRRGKPSCHKAFGEDTAILAGDALLTDAFTMLLRFGDGDVKAGGAYLGWAAGAGGMVHGQILDCKVPKSERDIHTLDEININKTGRLIQASVAGCAAYLGADRETVSALERIGGAIGLAFQITDDILDITADEKELGKPVGSDAKLDKVTYPSLLGLDAAKERALDFIKKAQNDILLLPQNQFRDMLSEFADYIIERRS